MTNCNLYHDIEEHCEFNAVLLSVSCARIVCYKVRTLLYCVPWATRNVPIILKT
jgi:hypothetical protein